MSSTAKPRVQKPSPAGPDVASSPIPDRQQSDPRAPTCFERGRASVRCECEYVEQYPYGSLENLDRRECAHLPATQPSMLEIVTSLMSPVQATMTVGNKKPSQSFPRCPPRPLSTPSLQALIEEELMLEALGARSAGTLVDTDWQDALRDFQLRRDSLSSATSTSSSANSSIASWGNPNGSLSELSTSNMDTVDGLPVSLPFEPLYRVSSFAFPTLIVPGLEPLPHDPVDDLTCRTFDCQKCTCCVIMSRRGHMEGHRYSNRLRWFPRSMKLGEYTHAEQEQGLRGKPFGRVKAAKAGLTKRVGKLGRMSGETW